MMNQHTTASTCDTYRSAEATTRCGIARNQFTSGRQFAIRSGGSKANAAGYGPPIACMDDHLRCRIDPTGGRRRSGEQMQNLSGEALNSAGQDELAAGARPNPAPSQRTDLPRTVRTFVPLMVTESAGAARSEPGSLDRCRTSC